MSYHLDHSSFNASLRSHVKEEGDVSLDNWLSTTAPSKPPAPLPQPEKFSQELVEEFATIFQSHSEDNQLLEMVQLFKQSCQELATRMGNILHDGKGYRHNATASRLHSQTEKLVVELEEEARTWHLVHQLYMERLLSAEIDAQSMEQEQLAVTTTHNWRLPPRYMQEVNAREETGVVKAAFDADSALRECDLVLQWLEVAALEGLARGAAAAEEQFAGDYKYAEDGIFHLRAAMAKTPGLLERGSHYLSVEGVVMNGREHSGSDTAEEERFVRHLFRLLRAGQVKRAQELCLKAGDFARASIFEACEFASASEGEGNPYRELQCIVYRQLARDSRVKVYERAIYALLCGDLDVLLSVCETSADVLWAHLRVWLQSRLRAYVHANTLYASSQNTRTCLPLRVNAAVEDALSDADVSMTHDKDTALHKLSLREVMRRVQEVCVRLHLWDKCGVSTVLMFTRVQMALVGDDLEGLLSLVHEEVMKGQAELSPSMLVSSSVLDKTAGSTTQHQNRIIPVYLQRFGAHLTLLLRRLHDTMNTKPALEEAFMVPLVQSFVSSIIHIQRQLAPNEPSRFVKIVAAYVANLPPNMQVETFAYFLEYVVDTEERMVCLDAAEKRCLDTNAIISSIVQRVREKFPSQPSGVEMEGLLSSARRVTKKDPPLSVIQLQSTALQPLDLLKVEAIGWLVIHPQHCLEAVQQSNAMARDFLLINKLEAATQVMMKLPPRCTEALENLLEEYRQLQRDRGKASSLPPDDMRMMQTLANTYHEHISLRLYVEMRQAHSHFLSQPRSDNADGQELALKELANRVLDLIRCPRWMRDEGVRRNEDNVTLGGNKNQEEYRLEQMSQLRHHLMRDAVFLLMDAVLISPLRMQSLAMDLVNTLMDSQWGHETTLRPTELAELLGKVKKLLLKDALLKTDLSHV